MSPIFIQNIFIVNTSKTKVNFPKNNYLNLLVTESIFFEIRLSIQPMRNLYVSLFLLSVFCSQITGLNSFTDHEEKVSSILTITADLDDAFEYFQSSLKVNVSQKISATGDFTIFENNWILRSQSVCTDVFISPVFKFWQFTLYELLFPFHIFI